MTCPQDKHNSCPHSWENGVDGFPKTSPEPFTLISGAVGRDLNAGNVSKRSAFEIQVRCSAQHLKLGFQAGARHSSKSNDQVMDGTGVTEDVLTRCCEFTAIFVVSRNRCQSALTSQTLIFASN